MEIVTAKTEDISRILEIFQDARNFMNSHGFTQWEEGYPNFQIVNADISAGACYICREKKKIFSTFVFSDKEEPLYQNLMGGHWRLDEKYGVVHRVAVADEARNQGFGNKIFNFIENTCKEQGIKQIRVDTHEENKPMKNLLEKFGFNYCGCFYKGNGDRRVAYDKII